MEISKRIKNLVEKFTQKSGTTTHPNEEVTEAVMQEKKNYLKKECIN